MPSFQEHAAERWREWPAPDGWTRIMTVDAHAAGEPLRVVFAGFDTGSGETVLERRRFAGRHTDALRSALMWEPRGHADMYGCVLMPPLQPDADFAVLFTHNEGYSTMCGHGIIAVTTVVLETGLFPMRSPQTTLRIDTPAGRVLASATIEAGRVAHVAFLNVASFAVSLDDVVDVPGLGAVRYDLAFGGAYYAYVDAAPLRLGLEPRNVRALIDTGTAIKRAVSARREIVHPDDPDLGFLYGTIFTGAVRDDVHSRHVCVFAEGEVDRSPTGTGVSGRAALLRARGQLARGDDAITIDSIIGSRFTVRIADEARVGEHDAVIPEVGGRAWITGRHEYLIDPTDPLASGFLVR